MPRPRISRCEWMHFSLCIFKKSLRTRVEEKKDKLHVLTFSQFILSITLSTKMRHKKKFSYSVKFLTFTLKDILRTINYMILSKDNYSPFLSIIATFKGTKQKAESRSRFKNEEIKLPTQVASYRTICLSDSVCYNGSVSVSHSFNSSFSLLISFNIITIY